MLRCPSTQKSAKKAGCTRGTRLPRAGNKLAATLQPPFVELAATLAATFR